MKPATNFIAVLAGVLTLSSPLQAATVFEAVGNGAASIQQTVDDFRAALGTLNANAPVNANGGRREINWDAAPDVVSDPNPFPGNFFNANVAPRARGIEFKETGSTTGFKLSSTAASGVPVEFGFPNGFDVFSPERLFTPIGGTTFDVLFFDPANPLERATTNGLGVVFTDVENPTSTQMSFYDTYDNLLFKRNVLAGANSSLSFLGVLFDDPLIARVSITAGLEGFDSVVMDDFIFGEPIPANVAPVPLPTSAFLLLGGLSALGAQRWRRKRAA